jgi:hypothetical protein
MNEHPFIIAAILGVAAACLLIRIHKRRPRT